MKRIRINNDFTFAWAIERNGLPEDLSTAINMVLQARNSAGTLQTITDYDVAGNVVSVEVTPEIANVLGRYVFILTYELPDAGLSDLERLCEIDTDAFILVPRTAEADDAEDLLVTSDMAIGFKGDSAYQVWLDAGNVGTLEDYFEDIKGDPFLYSDFTPEQIAELQQPATDAIASIQETELAVEQAEELRVTAEISRKDAELLRASAETSRNNAEQNRQTNTATAIQNAELAAGLANEKATLANDAALLANEKAGLADEAATNANNVANTYAAELALKELKANKQNSLATDGTGTKFPTVDAVNEGFQPKLNSGTNIKTVNGESLLGSGDLAVSGGSDNLIASYTHSGNKEVAVTAVDISTNTFTKIAHGLVNGDIIAPTINNNLTANVYPLQVYSTGILQQTYYVVNKTDDTFQVSVTSGGAPVDITAAGDLTKWHFEVFVTSNISITSLPSNESYVVLLIGKDLLNNGNIYVSANNLGFESKWLNSNRTTFTLPFITQLSLGTVRGFAKIILSNSTFPSIHAIGSSFCVNNSNPTAYVSNKFDTTLTMPIANYFGNITSIQISMNGCLSNGTTIKIYKL